MSAAWVLGIVVTVLNVALFAASVWLQQLAHKELEGCYETLAEARRVVGDA